MLPLRPTPALSAAGVAPRTGAFPAVRPRSAGLPAAVAPPATAVARAGAGRLLGALSTTLALRSGLGNGPWDTLTVAVHHASGVGVGAVSTAFSAAFTAAAWALGARPNPLALAANAAAGGLAVDWLLPRVAPAAGAGAATAYLAGSLAAAVGGAVIVLGTPQARTAYDHLLLGVVRRRGWTLRRARWTLDVPALGAGYALGGAVGAGTVAGALLVGPLSQRAAARLARWRGRPPGRPAHS